MTTYLTVAIIIATVIGGLFSILLQALWQRRIGSPALPSNPATLVAGTTKSMRSVEVEGIIQAIMDVDRPPHPNPYPPGSQARAVWFGGYAMSAAKAREAALSARSFAGTSGATPCSP